ncbi:MAG: bifunctional nuclease domain-containing protein [Flavobacteriales bacterium]
MKKVEVEVTDMRLSGSSSGAYAMVLSEVNGERKLPIVIAGTEAQSIAIVIENMKASRPLTHDVFKAALDAFDIRVMEVNIHNMVEGVYFANLICGNDLQTEEIDCRTSDAVAIAYRFGCPIYCAESVMKVASIGPEEMNRVSEADEEESAETPPKKRTIKELKKELSQAISREDYELASRLRDEIQRRENPKSE